MWQEGEGLTDNLKKIGHIIEKKYRQIINDLLGWLEENRRKGGVYCRFGQRMSGPWSEMQAAISPRYFAVN